MRGCTIARARPRQCVAASWAAIVRRGTIKGLVLAAHGLLLVYLLAPVQPRSFRLVSPSARRPAVLQVELIAPRQPIHRPIMPHRTQHTMGRPLVRAGPLQRVRPHPSAPPPQQHTTLSLTWQPTVATSTAANIDAALAARRAKFGTRSRTTSGHVPTLPGQSCYRTAFHFVPENRKGLRGVFTTLEMLTTPPQLREELAPKEYEPIACADPPGAGSHRDALAPSPPD